MSEKLPIRPGLHEVAKVANVSIATVSRAINNPKGSVTPETRKRVMAAVEKLNYRPNMIARSFRSQKTKTIGIIVSDITHPHVANLIAGAESVLKKSGYIYILSNAANSLEGEKIGVELFLQNRVDGILSTGFAGPSTKDIFFPLIENNVPLVLIGSSLYNNKVPSVYVDHARGGYLATEHLIKSGHKNILYMSGYHPDSEPRLKGYRNALKDADIPINDDLVIYGGNTPEDGYKSIIKFLNKNNCPTAIFCFDDTVALGAMRGIYEKGLKIPSDCSVIGFDNIPYCQFSCPKLTTIAQPAVQMGEQGAKLLLELLNGKDGASNKRIVFQPNLVLRESTGKRED